MIEIDPVRSLIIDNDESKIRSLSKAILALGSRVTLIATSLAEVENIFNSGSITPTEIDVAFVDSDIGQGRGDGKEVIRLLEARDLIRDTFTLNYKGEEFGEQVCDPNRIVTIGISNNPGWAAQLGSYSDTLRKPLTVAVDHKDLLPNLELILTEVRRLKPSN